MDYKKQLLLWEKRRQKMLALRKSGKTLAEIAAVFRITRSAVHKALAKI